MTFTYRGVDRRRPVQLLVLGAAVAALLAFPSPAASQHTDSLLLQSVEWYTGVAGRVDQGRAAELLREAAADEDPVSLMWIARVHSRGRMGFAEDPERDRAIAAGVIDRVEELAERGEAEALFLMGTAYAEGLGVESDPAEAVTWYRRAAAEEHVLAQHNLGNVYFAGEGVPQSDSLAVEWWLEAAHQGDAIPALRLGAMYEEGRGVTRDLAEARRWYRESASRGNEAAQAALQRLESG